MTHRNMNNSEITNQLQQIQNTIGQITKDIQSGIDVNLAADLIKHVSITLYGIAANASGISKHNAIANDEIKLKNPVEVPESEKATKQINEILAPKPEPITSQDSNPVVISIPEPVIQTEIEPVKPVAKTAELTKTPPAKEALKPIEINESVSIDELSLNDRFSKTKTPAINFADKSKESPIRDLTKAISISKKFEFINGLFNGNADQYKACINTIQNADSYEAAIEFTETAADQTLWEENEKLASEFFSLIRRRFNQ